jgi:hypothetical protein
MRHIEKLKKIFTCCGKECSADTNGQALDQLVTLAENGELGGGVDVLTVLNNLKVSCVSIPTSTTPQLKRVYAPSDTLFKDCYMVIFAPGHEPIILDNIRYIGGTKQTLVPETSVGSGAYIYQMTYTVNSDASYIDFEITVTTCNASLGNGVAFVCCKKEL